VVLKVPGPDAKPSEPRSQWAGTGNHQESVQRVGVGPATITLIEGEKKGRDNTREEKKKKRDGMGELTDIRVRR